MTVPPSSSQPVNRSLERQAVWEAALRQNRLPGFVTDRLNRARDGKIPWLSTMTTAELLIAKTHGIHPVAMVSGTCVAHLPAALSKGFRQAWAVVVDRVRQEALAAGANAIVDATLHTLPIGPRGGMDYTLRGSAVRIEGLPPSPDPVIATVSTLEFVRLLQAGIVPAGIAAVAVAKSFAVRESIYDPDSPPLEGKYKDITWPMRRVGELWEEVRALAIEKLEEATRMQGNGVLAHTHISDLFPLGSGKEDISLYLARHIIIGTIVDTTGTSDVPHEIRSVVDMRHEPLGAMKGTERKSISALPDGQVHIRFRP